MQTAQYFAHSYYRHIDKYFKYIGKGAEAFILKQEQGQEKADKILNKCNEHDKLVFDLLNIGWVRASQQVIQYIDSIVEDQIEGFGFFVFWIDIENCTNKILKPILISLGKNIQKKGLYDFLLNHPKLKEKPLWQKYVFAKPKLVTHSILHDGNKIYTLKF